MNYSEALEYTHAIPRFVRPLGNEKLNGLLRFLGNPQNKLKFVHVAGTNGKGSVCAMTAEILKRAGYRTGLFTSPFIEVFNERIRINGEMIKDNALAEYITEISSVMEKNDMCVSEFAFITAVAMKYFADMDCDIVVLETGMGGRLDATNIIPPPEVSVITSISLDHTQYLGNTIEEIAREKCGIIKDGAEVVSAPNTAVSDIISAASGGRAVFACDYKKSQNGFIYKSREYALSLKGEYQAENAAVVLEVVEALKERGFRISDADVADGLKNTLWQARFEFITPDIVIDGGHNIDGVRALKKSLVSLGREVVLVMAMMQDKDYAACIKEIAPVAREVYATQLQLPRALDAGEIVKVCQKTGVTVTACQSVAQALCEAQESLNGALLCVCGSLYLAGEARGILKKAQ